MPTIAELLKQDRKEDLWQMCCGYVGLSIEQFMTIQKRLLQEQIELLNHCDLGKKIMRGARPQTIEEFREQVPLTAYADYLPELAEQREDILPEKPAFWIRTSGKSGEYHCKWVPISESYANELSIVMYGLGNLSNCKDWHDTSNFPNHPKLVYTVAPRPYTSGALACVLSLQAPVEYLPPIEVAESLSFEERIELGFSMALSRGLEFFFGLSLVLVAVGEKFRDSSGKVDILPLLTKPKKLLRLAKGLIKSKIARRPMLPKDLWNIKGIISSGLDSQVYREKIKELWGRYPLDVYGSTEGSIMATQTWDYGTMTFTSSLNFYEFIPEKEHIKNRLDSSYQPKTVLLDEVKPEENYEIVLTNFHGGAMVRYRIGDMIRIDALRNDNLGIELPQMSFVGRADDLIDFGVTRLTEKLIWQAIENTGIPYADWTARKEVGEHMSLHIFIELKDNCPATETEIATAIGKEIKRLDASFIATKSDVGGYLDFEIEITSIPEGAFADYIARRRAEGSELAHLKPPHINPSDGVLSLLMSNKKEASAVEAGVQVAD